MSIQKEKLKLAKRRAFRVRQRIRRDSNMPRVSIFRSNQHIYAQLIDDQQGTTIASSSSQAIEHTGDKKSVARVVGKHLAEKAKQANINVVIFDRGRYLYHGRVQELAEGLREGGLKF